MLQGIISTQHKKCRCATIGNDLWQGLKRISQRNKVPMSEILRVLIRNNDNLHQFLARIPHKEKIHSKQRHRSLTIEDELWFELKRLSKQENKPVTRIIRELLKNQMKLELIKEGLIWKAGKTFLIKM